MYKYSPTTNGFYIDEIHGDNIPSDCIDVTDELHEELISSQSQGKIIVYDKKSKQPISQDRPQPSERDILISEIYDLESTITQRRIREAILGTDNGWLANVETQIAALREKL